MDYTPWTTEEEPYPGPSEFEDYHMGFPYSTARVMRLLRERMKGLQVITFARDKAYWEDAYMALAAPEEPTKEQAEETVYAPVTRSGKQLKRERGRGQVPNHGPRAKSIFDRRGRRRY